MQNFKSNFSNYKNVWGIYCIRNIINNKRYIGSAVNLKERIHQHYHELIIGIHFNDHLQRSFNKYGESNFEVSILEVCDVVSYDELLKIEDKYIVEYNSIDDNFGYNNRLSNTFPKLSDKSIQIRKNKHDLTKIPIVLCDAKTGKFYKEFESVTDVAIFLGDQTTNISKARDCLSKHRSGYVIISKSLYDPNKLYIKQKCHKSERTKLLMRSRSSKNMKVYAYSKDGSYITYISFSEACRQLKLNPDSLSHASKRHKYIIYNEVLYSRSIIDDNFNEIYKTAYVYEPGVIKNQFGKCNKQKI